MIRQCARNVELTNEIGMCDSRSIIDWPMCSPSTLCPRAFCPTKGHSQGKNVVHCETNHFSSVLEAHAYADNGRPVSQPASPPLLTQPRQTNGHTYTHTQT